MSWLWHRDDIQVSSAVTWSAARQDGRHVDVPLAREHGPDGHDERGPHEARHENVHSITEKSALKPRISRPAPLLMV
jgi:hypothetical protein